MKVGELVEFLLGVNDDLEVYISYEGQSYPLEENRVRVELKEYMSDESLNKTVLNIGE